MIKDDLDKRHSSGSFWKTLFIGFSVRRRRGRETRTRKTRRTVESQNRRQRRRRRRGMESKHRNSRFRVR